MRLSSEERMLAAEELGKDVAPEERVSPFVKNDRKKTVINVTLMSTKMVTKITTLFVACFQFVLFCFSFFFLIIQ